jgi:hypothetical protein
VALLLVASLSLILVHWHRDSRGQDCGLCSVQQMPGLGHVSSEFSFVPAPEEWAEALDSGDPVPSGFVSVLPGRAPPSADFSL